MSKITLTDLANLQNENTAVSAINGNNAIIETAFDNTLSRDGTSPNQMGASLDMNSNRVLNLPEPITANEPLRLQDLEDFVGGSFVLSPIPSGGTTGQFLGKNSNTSYDVGWKTGPVYFYNVKDYGAVGNGVTLDNAAILAAIAAAVASNGGTVFFPAGSYLINAILDLNNTKNIRLLGDGGNNSGGATSSSITYTGATSAVRARDSVGTTLEGLAIYGTEAARLIDLRGSAGNTTSCRIRNCLILHLNTGTPSASRITVDYDKNENVLIEDSTIAANGCIELQGADTGGYVINSLIKNCVFPNMSANTVHLKSPGSEAIISNCSFETPASGTSIVKGPAGTSSQVTLISNFFGDGGVKTTPLVTTNSQNLVSIGNCYGTSIGGGGSSTCIQMDNSSGSITSIGDWIEADVGFAMGTGNTLSVINPNRTHSPTTMYTGTLASTGTTSVIGGPVDIVGAIDFSPSNKRIQVGNPSGNSFIGLGAATGQWGGLFWNFASSRLEILTAGYSLPVQIDGSAINIGTGSASTVTVNNGGVAPTGTGAYVRATTPTLVTPILGTPTSGNLQNCTGTASGLTAGTATNAVNVGITNDTTTNAAHYFGMFTANTGNLPTKVSSTKIAFNPSSGNLAVGTGSVRTDSFLSVEGSGLTASTQLLMYFAPTFSSSATASAYGLYMAPNTQAASYTIPNMYNIFLTNGVKGASSIVTSQYQLYIATPTMGNTNNYSIFSAGGRNTLTDGLAVGTDVTPPTGGIQASGSIRSSSATGGVGYTTGSGSTVTQATSKSTGVTLNFINGQITMNNASLAASTSVMFTLTNSTIAATDVVIVNIKSGATSLAYQVGVEAIAAGSCNIVLRNVSGGALGEAVVLQYAVIKGSNT